MRNIENYKQLITEKVATTIAPISGAVALNYIDISNPNDPLIVIRGAYSMNMSGARRDLAMRLNKIANQLLKSENSGQGLDMAYKVLSGEDDFGDRTAFIMRAYAEAERTLALPANKAKLTLAKKKKRGLA